MQRNVWFFPPQEQSLCRFLSTSWYSLLLLSLYYFLCHTVSCCFSYFSLVKPWPQKTGYTIDLLSWSLFYPVSWDHPQLFAWFLKLHSWYKFLPGLRCLGTVNVWGHPVFRYIIFVVVFIFFLWLLLFIFQKRRGSEKEVYEEKRQGNF